MKLFSILALLGMGLVAGCKSTDNDRCDQCMSGAHDISTMAKSDKSSAAMTSTLYTCPMHPEVVSKEPGKCPKCNMDLVQKK